MSDEEQRVFLIDADSDDRASLYYGDSWRCVDTMPETGHVECLTVTGLIRHAEAQRSRDAICPSDAKGPRRLRVNGVQAIAWRPWADHSKKGFEEMNTDPVTGAKNPGEMVIEMQAILHNPMTDEQGIEYLQKLRSVGDVSVWRRPSTDASGGVYHHVIYLRCWPKIAVAAAEALASVANNHPANTNHIQQYGCSDTSNSGAD